MWESAAKLCILLKPLISYIVRAYFYSIQQLQLCKTQPNELIYVQQIHLKAKSVSQRV